MSTLRTVIAAAAACLLPVMAEAEGPGALLLAEYTDLRRGYGPVLSQAWDPDGSRLYTADHQYIRVWNPHSGARTALIEGHQAGIEAMAVYRDQHGGGGGWLATGDAQGVLIVRNIDTLEPRFTLELSPVKGLASSPDGGSLAVACASGSALVLDAADGEALAAVRRGGGAALLAVAWSPDGRLVATGDRSGIVELWDAGLKRTTGRIDAAGGANAVTGLAWRPDGAELAIALDSGKVLVVPRGEEKPRLAIAAHEGWARGLAWSPGGAFLASSGEDRNIRLWRVGDGSQYAWQYHNSLPVLSVAWSPEGTFLSSGAGDGIKPHVGATIVWKMP